MNPIELPIGELKQALTGFAKIIARTPTLPILNKLLVNRDSDGWITLTATDLESFATVRLEIPSQGEVVSIIVSYPELVRLTKNCNSAGSISVCHPSTGKTMIQYLVGNHLAQFEVPFVDIDDYPEIPTIAGESQRVDDSVRISILEAMQCTSGDSTRYVLQGAYLDVSDDQSHYVVGTDGRHLYSSNSIRIPASNSIILPDRKFIRWKVFAEDGEWRMRWQPRVEETCTFWAEISSRRWTYLIKHIDGNFPNWRQVIPDPGQYTTDVEFTGESAKKAIELIPHVPFEDDENAPITVALADGKVHLAGRGEEEHNWMTFEVPEAKYTGRPFSARLNRNYLEKALRLGLRKLSIIDPRSPLRFSDRGRQMIVMPLQQPAKRTDETRQPETTSAPEEKVEENQERKTEVNADENAETTVPTVVAEPEQVPIIEQAISTVDYLRGQFSDGLSRLKELTVWLKQAQREQKTSTREMQLFRTRLKELQALKL